MTEIVVGVVDVYAVRPRADGWRVLVLQRALDTRCPTAWETVHGHIEPAERPADAALRELREETGLEAERLYNVTCQPFYLHVHDVVQMAVVFCAFVAEPALVTLGAEHAAYEWLDLEAAARRFAWPRERESLAHIRALLGSGDAGPVEDVLRVK
jgi:8-oxo-dGTP pyrophosphatase MutT (NUDIX family)